MSAVELHGRVALVTGGASGIGLATARRLRGLGMRVAVADLGPPPEGSCDLAVEADAGDAEVWPRLLEAVTERLGGLHLAHLNAGMAGHAPDLDDLDLDWYRRLMRVNVDHVVLGIRACARDMADRGGGRIVVTASLAGLTAMPTNPVYTASKHAVVGLVRAAAARLAERGVVLTAVCPGIVDTPLIGDAREALRDAGFPLIGADDVAAAVVDAATTAAAGECLVVQAGREPVAFRFPNVPGPRVPGREGMRPPL